MAKAKQTTVESVVPIEERRMRLRLQVPAQGVVHVRCDFNRMNV
jgi:hypothetical protein